MTGKRSIGKAMAALFFAAFFLLGLFTAADYGPGWDEPDEMNILRMNLWQYARNLGLDEHAFEALPDEGRDITTCAPSPIAESIEKDHGAAVFYPLAPLVMNGSLSRAEVSRGWHIGCWAWFTLAALGLYGALRQLGLSRGMSLFGPVLLLLMPQLFAQGHFNNKDIPLLALTALMMSASLRLMRRPCIGTALLFALEGALAANLKLIGAALFGLCALAVLAGCLKEKRPAKAVIPAAVSAVTGFLAFWFLLTPAMWPDAAGFVKYLLNNAASFDRWHGTVLFRGALFPADTAPLPRYYLPWMIFAATPLWILLLTAAGQLDLLCRGARSLKERSRSSTALWLPCALLALPLLAAAVLHTSLYNGWRHFYFLAAPMVLGASWGISRASEKLKGVGKTIGAGVLVLCMATQGVCLFTEHPRQYAYYQPLCRAAGAEYDLDYWNVGALEAVKAVLDETSGPVTVSGSDYYSLCGVKRAAYALEYPERLLVTEDPEQADYILENVSYSRIACPGLPNGLQIVSEQTCCGQSVMRMWKTSR